MVGDGIRYRDLKNLIEQEFQNEVEGVVRRLSYCPPAELSMFSSGKTPPGTINTDTGVDTFFQLGAAMKSLNLLVTFEIQNGADAAGRTANAIAAGQSMIRLADATPSLSSGGAGVESCNVVNEAYVFGGQSGAGLTTGQAELDINSSAIDLNSIYDAELVAELVAQLEIVEAMAKEAQGLKSRKGKEKVTDVGNVREQGSGSEDWDLYPSREDQELEFNYWNAVVNRECRGLQGGLVLEQGESSTAVRVVTAPESVAEIFATEDDILSVLQTGFPGVPLPEDECLVEGPDTEEDLQVEDDIQLSLANIYNEIIEGDVVPSHDCEPCFGDEYLQTQDVQNGVYDPGNDAIFIGRIFRTKAEMQTALAIYAIKRFFNFKQTRSDKDRLIVRCVDMNCAWRVYGHRCGGNSQNMVVRTATLTHSCDIATRSQYGKKASCKVIAEVLKSKYSNSKVGPRAVDIPDIVLDELRVSITYMKAWQAKEKAVTDARGTAAESYKLLSACIHASQFMRRVFIIDATRIKAKYKGCLLTASFQDGNFQIMPLGFGVVDNENEPAWTWFFKQLVSIIPDSSDLVFVSDRHNSIYAALRSVYPLARHGACAVHLYRNVKTRFARQQGLAYAVAKAASAYTVGEFIQRFDEIERRSTLYANYLRGIGISHWRRVYFQGKRYNIMSSNVVECLNAALAKALEFPIVSMVETIRMMLMRWFYCRRSKAEAHNSPVTPEVEEIMMKSLSESAGLSVKPASSSIFQVNTSAGASFIVDLERKTCTCKVFESLGIPCSHAMAAARSNGTPIPDLAEDYYKTDAWRSAYSAVVMLVPNGADEDVPEELVNEERLPPQGNAGPGRPRKRRIPSAGENSRSCRRKRAPGRCSRCFGTGHNKATCRNPIP
ncbi:Zinc finger SWIM-type [Arabidopsis suecica]|uniref:Zinc finger SWIM-type n=1 Tax=Arabidopsis suecica TaxID=45249 RepID=A0A8T1ZEM1_ARASU|nr:Zinc finger SWIM-type [Arabidopsis suecica]